MGSVLAYSTSDGRRYRVLYRKPDHSQGQKRGFRTKRDAELYLAEVELSKARGEFIDASSARARVDVLGDVWLAAQEQMLKPSAFAPLESTWRLHVRPIWGSREIGGIRHSEVQTWVSELAKRMSATSTLRAYGILAGILDVAVKDRRIASNPARDLTLPRKKGKAKVYLSHTQVELLAESSAHPTLV